MDWRNEIALKQHAYVMGQCVLALARIEGMKAENQTALTQGRSLPYGEEQFKKEMIDYQIDHNSVIGLFTY